MSSSNPGPAGVASGSGTALLSQPLLGPAGIAIGILSILVGILLLVVPGATLLLIAILFGIQLVVMGVIRIVVSARVPSGSGWIKPVGIVLGVLTVLAGIFCFVHPGASLIVLAIFLAAGWIVEGIATLAQAFSPGRSGGTRAFFGISGVVSIIAGIIVAVAPGRSLLLLTMVAGVALIIIGIFELVAAIAHRRQPAATV